VGQKKKKKGLQFVGGINLKLWETGGSIHQKRPYEKRECPTKKVTKKGLLLTDRERGENLDETWSSQRGGKKKSNRVILWRARSKEEKDFILKTFGIWVLEKR